MDRADAFTPTAATRRLDVGVEIWTDQVLLPSLESSGLGNLAAFEAATHENATAAAGQFSGQSTYLLAAPGSQGIIEAVTTGFAHSADFDTAQTILPVPEPPTGVLLLFGAALGLRRRTLRTHERSAA